MAEIGIGDVVQYPLNGGFGAGVVEAIAGNGVAKVGIGRACPREYVYPFIEDCIRIGPAAYWPDGRSAGRAPSLTTDAAERPGSD
jgi:hypothetical protein